MRVLVTRHQAVEDFAALTIKPDRILRTIGQREVDILPDGSAIFGNLPLPVVSTITAPRPKAGRLHYYHLIIPHRSQGSAISLDHLFSVGAYWQEFHVSPGPILRAHSNMLTRPAEKG